MSAARFDRPELAPLWAEARRRFEASDGPVNRIRLHDLQPDARAALADLLGLAQTPDPDVTVRLRTLDALLCAATGLDTRGVVEAIGGPITSRAGQRRQRATERADLWQWARQHPVVVAEPALLTWLDRVRTSGLAAGDVSAARLLLGQAFEILAALPAAGEPLAVLAARFTSDSHALDDDSRLGKLILRALAALHDEDPPTEAEGRRQLWERSGVACDELSTSVLVAGLRPGDDGPLAEGLRNWADAGQAALVTLAQLRHHPISQLHGPVFIVENPAVVAAALRRFGVACPPLVCTAGWPSTAAIMLLRDIAAAGVHLRYHGDFDGDGLRIAAHVMSKTGAQPWLLHADDYVQAVPAAGPVVGRVDNTPWDPQLAEAVRAHGVALLEEVVVESLLADMSHRPVA
ncbi:TIGR02679 family protein [Micromonospora sp. DR5-3]|uniref:TIGR02679 family protein n=1 Tax=unclassified Micromonospora TaxID=2617518 RepID=UPI0011DA0487|nr:MULTISPECIES: TIGR02679 family protein [unclassified Micromonospora]MCW3820108.1 TIGR02679 family protein [Micromonospora sp. DR5-3]TYC19404.1 TIGR02679 family protein [Micromonospora sp. MP36]